MKKEPICQLCNGQMIYYTYIAGDGWTYTTCPNCNPADPWYRKKPSEPTKTKKPHQ
ncbi:MAG: hypothetical protein KME09_07170 [Pleurocapsa minor HA4230-MV1]|nr:hypothetical protein [Pleurocapsa minor HA4230-MV1]